MKDVDTPAKTPLYPAPEGFERPLRVVLVGPPQVPGWVSAFHALATVYDWIELVTLTDSAAVLPQVQGVAMDVRAFVALEHALLSGNRSLAPVPMPTDPGSHAEAWHAYDMPLPARISALHPDLVILVGPPAWAATLAGSAPWGCWCLDASLVDQRHAGLSLLAPMVRGETATQMALMLQEQDQAPIDLAVSWGRTRKSSFLVQREDAFRKLPALLLRALHRLAGGYVPANLHAVATVQLQSPSSMGGAVGVRALLSIVRASHRWLTGWFRNDRIGWTLVLRLGGTALDPQAPAIGSHALLKAPKGWWGDPFVVIAEGRKLVFVEEMAEPKLKKANIACLELTGGGARRLGIALDEPGHLSFPQAFLWQGQWYLTVETGYDRRVSLYRATGFPMEWTRVRDLVTGWVCVDPTLHHHDGHWYLFANVAENGNNTCDELFLFVADNLEGPFVPHPASPIACDVRRARMAGRLFHHQGRLIRPAQDCGPGYGNALVFNEVLELGPKVYRERQLSRLAPYLTRSVDGCHTYNVDGGVEILDVLGRPPNRTAYLHVSDGPGNHDVHNGAPPDRLDPMVTATLPATGGTVHRGLPPQ
ncbi:glucosamine inositolphosphorylceramide transferase family protein [Lysobacter fragariae]